MNKDAQIQLLKQGLKLAKDENEHLKTIHEHLRRAIRKVAVNNQKLRKQLLGVEDKDV